MTTERPPVHDRCRFRAAGFWPAALAACLLVGSVRAAPIAPRAATLGTAEALRWIGQASPGGVAVSTTLLGGGPTPCLSRGGALVTFDSAWKARVTEAPDDALILTYRIHREVDGFWRERQFGVAVVHAGRLVWAVESEAAFSFRGLPCGLVSLRAGEPLAIRLSYEFTADPVAPRLALRRERIFAFLDGAFRQVLDDTTDVDAHGR